jgi:hypothetical protein
MRAASTPLPANESLVPVRGLNYPAARSLAYRKTTYQEHAHG